RGERGAVLDDALLTAVPPDEMRNVMDVRPGAGRDRRQAHGRQRWEDRRSAAVIAVCGKKRECGRAALGGALERLRRHAVDDDQDELLPGVRHRLTPSVLGERAQPGVRL